MSNIMIFSNDWQGRDALGGICCRLTSLATLFFLYKQPVYKQPVLRPLKNVATFEAQKSPVA